MALFLVHLRRLILLLSVVHLTGSGLGRLLTERHYGHMLQPHGYSDWEHNSRWTKDPVHFQWWAYIYICYAYVLLVNYVSMRRLTNLIEFLLTSSLVYASFFAEDLHSAESAIYVPLLAFVEFVSALGTK